MEEFRRVRDAQEAVFFYVLYLFPFLLVRLLILGGTALFTQNPVYNGFLIGNGVAVLFCVGVGIVILSAKGHAGHPGYWGLLLVGAVGALAAGAVLGLIPVAFLTTRRIHGSGYSEGEWQRETEVPLEDL